MFKNDLKERRTYSSSFDVEEVAFRIFLEHLD